MTDYRRILLIKPSSLGDIVHALPTLAALRARYPRAHIAWLVKRQWAGVLERVEGVDRIWPVDPTVRGWLSHVPPLRAAAFDLAVDLQGLFRSGAMARLAGCRTRIGFANAREGAPLFYTHRVPVPAPDMHAVDRYLLAAAAAGAARPEPPVFPLRATAADFRAVGALLQARGLASADRWIAVNVSARWPTKRWPPAAFAAAADLLHREGAWPVVFVGAPDDKPIVREVTSRMTSPVRDLTGETAPELLPALLGGAALLVTNDSGPMHVAAAMGTPVVALFGPTNPLRTGPYGARHCVLRAGIPCSPCYSRQCRHAKHLECLTSITPDQVVAAVRERLQKTAEARASVPT